MALEKGEIDLVQSALYHTPIIGQQLSFPELTAHLSTSRLAIGAAGEVLAARALEQTGYRVDIPHERGDLTVITSDGQILYVEVKSSRANKDGTYHFTLWKHWQGRQCADHRQADVVVLLCILKTGRAIPFVIPVAAITDKKAVAITSYPPKYKGWLSQYRQNIKKLRID